jgi:hypothetical protein
MSQQVRDVSYETDDLVHKFGQLINSDIADVPADLYDYGANGEVPVYPWTTTAKLFTVDSSSVNDDGNDPEALGTGAQTVFVEGVDDALGTVTGIPFGVITEEVVMNGTDAVTMSTPLWRVNRAYVGDVGSGLTNAGDIDVLDGAAIVARIQAGNGQTLQAIFTVPDRTSEQLTKRFLKSWRASFTGAIPTSSEVTLYLYMRLAGKGWRVQETAILTNANPTAAENLPDPGEALVVGSDWRWVVTANNKDNVNIDASFAIVFKP